MTDDQRTERGLERLLRHDREQVIREVLAEIEELPTTASLSPILNHTRNAEEYRADVVEILRRRLKDA